MTSAVPIKLAGSASYQLYTVTLFWKLILDEAVEGVLSIDIIACCLQAVVTSVSLGICTVKRQLLSY